MNSSLTSHKKKFKAIVYTRVGSEVSIRIVEDDPHSKLYAMAKQLTETKYYYRNLPKVHGLIIEEYLKRISR
jgi:hypothetical protein